MRRLFIGYVNWGHIIWLRSTSSNIQVINNYSPQTGGTAGTLIFWFQVPGMTLYNQLIYPAGAWLQMTGAHNLFCLYALVKWPLPPAQGNVEDFDFVSAVPQSNHPTVGTASWQNHDSPPPQYVIILHCHVCLCLSNTYISSALLRHCKSTFARLSPPCSEAWVKPRGEGYSIFSRLGSFFGVQNFEFQYFWGFSEKWIFFVVWRNCGYFLGHHTIGLYSGFISMQFLVFS